VVVELLDLLVDVGGTRLTHRGGEVEPEGVVDRFRFPTVP
jgi:hypothetical protein